MSKLPLKEVTFKRYTKQGYYSRLTDGESFIGKGVGRVRLAPADNMTIDILVTHTVSEDHNADIRYKKDNNRPCMRKLGISMGKNTLKRQKLKKPFIVFLHSFATE